MSFHDTSTAWVRDVIDCLAAVAHDFEVVGYEEPERLLPNLSSVMVLLERMLILPAEELTDDTGEIFLKMRRSRWIQGIVQQYQQNESDLIEEAREAHFTFKRMLAKSRVTVDELIELEAFITSILVGLDEAISEEISRQREQELAANDAIEAFRSELDILGAPHDIDELRLLLTPMPQAETPEVVADALLQAKQTVADMILSKDARDAPLHIMFVDDLSPHRTDEVRRYTLFGISPYSPLPLGQDFDPEDGVPLRKSDHGRRIAEDLEEVEGFGACFFVSGALVASLQDGYSWDEGFDASIVATISNVVGVRVITIYEKHLLPLIGLLDEDEDDDDTASIGS